MKVAFVSQFFDAVLPPDQGSIGIWTYEVARRLAADHETTVIARRPRGGQARLRVEDIQFELLPCAPLRVWTGASHVWTRLRPHVQPLFAQGFYAIEFLTQTTRALRRLAPDVIHLQNFPHYVPAIRRAVPDAAIVLHMHCDWLSQLDYDSMARGVAAADLVIGCSSHVVSAARRRFPQARTQFAVVPNGTPLDRSAPTSINAGDSRVLFVGRISPEKGIHTLLDAWPKVVEAHPAARLDIVGPSVETPREFLIDLSKDQDVLDLSRFYPESGSPRGSYSSALRTMIPSQLAHTVTLSGPMPYERMPEKYAASSIVVNPSLSESFGMSLVEALATGTPVVATRVGGMPEIVEATGGGLLVEKNDPAALADAIVQLLSHPALREELGRRGAQRVAELYPWARIAVLTQDIHKEALSIRQQKGKRAS